LVGKQVLNIEWVVSSLALFKVIFHRYRNLASAHQFC
jgi:hypothetical protein